MSVLNCLMHTALPVRPVPEVNGIDEFATRKGQRYATVITDVVTGARVEVLADRAMPTVTA
jgi:transposase